MKCSSSSLFPQSAEPISYRDELVQQFTLDYAANEDKIRKLYEELEQETQRLHVHSLIVPTSSTDLRWRTGTHGRKVGNDSQA
jgi:hypothetical protein